ncbi:MAG: cyclodeaminase/cyclohydrolase family protein [Caldilineaceae bacterium]|nr:cyclodeaminase/cyclohydrolase family protein [Caldilineaceae bacterium]HRJ41593.1 cyclodeaminase/cyclohydrolase family protein [Caldilineaceae bacterium]
MTTVTHNTLQEFLDALASGESTPGGGGAAALTGSQAAALLSMVLNFTVGRKKYADIEAEMQGYLARSEELRAGLLALVDRDAAAFGAVSACYSMPKETDAEKAARTAAMQAAMKGAAEVPFVVAKHCLELLQLAIPIGEKGNSNVVSDAATSAYLALAALNAGLLNVEINLKYIKDGDFVAEWTGKVADLRAAAADAYTAAIAACSATLGVNV